MCRPRPSRPAVGKAGGRILTWGFLLRCIPPAAVRCKGLGSRTLWRARFNLGGFTRHYAERWVPKALCQSGTGAKAAICAANLARWASTIGLRPLPSSSWDEASWRNDPGAADITPWLNTDVEPPAGPQGRFAEKDLARQKNTASRAPTIAIPDFHAASSSREFHRPGLARGPSIRPNWRSPALIYPAGPLKFSEWR